MLVVDFMGFVIKFDDVIVKIDMLLLFGEVIVLYVVLKVVLVDVVLLVVVGELCWKVWWYDFLVGFG